jgi:WD40 repeat protein
MGREEIRALNTELKERIMRTGSVVIVVSLIMIFQLSAYGATLDKIAVLKDHKKVINYVAFSPDGKQMATCSEDNMVFIWDTATWKHTGTLASEDEPLAVAFAKDGKALFVVDHDNRLSRWDIETGVRSTNSRVGCAVNDLRMSPDGKTLAIACDSKSIVIWGVAENAMVKKLVGHKNDVMALAFSKDGLTLASGGKKRELIVWDTADWKQLKVMNDHAEDIACVAFSPGGDQVASGSFDNRVSIWDVKSGEKRMELAKRAQEGDRAIAWHPAGRLLISADRKTSKDTKGADTCETIAWNPASGVIQAAAPVDCGVNHLGITADGTTVAVGGEDISIFTVKE